MSGRWREGVELLERRLGEIPSALAAAAREDVSLDPNLTSADAIIATGVGSSAAHARFFADLVDRRTPIRARFEPLSAFLSSRFSEGLPLVVFSQGPSPNARIALADSANRRHTVLVTASTKEPSTDRLRVIRTAGENEFGTLVRVIGPMAGYVTAIRLAQSLGASITFEVATVLERLEEVRANPPRIDAEDLEANLAFLTSEGYGALVENLRYKILEGMLLPCPAEFDVLSFAHGLFQQAASRRTTLLALARADTAEEEPILRRIESMLSPERHRLVRLRAALPAPLSIFEHEAMLNAIMIGYVRERRLDQMDWPGRGADAALYDLT